MTLADTCVYWIVLATILSTPAPPTTADEAVEALTRLSTREAGRAWLLAADAESSTNSLVNSLRSDEAFRERGARRAAVEVLQYLRAGRYERGADFLLDCCEEEASISSLCAAALATIREEARPRAAEAIRRILSDHQRHESVVSAALQSLPAVEIAEEVIVPTLTSLMKDKTRAVGLRTLAARRLVGIIGAQDLVGRTDGLDVGASEAVLLALAAEAEGETISPPTADDAAREADRLAAMSFVRSAMSNEDERVRVAALYALVPVLREELFDTTEIGVTWEAAYRRVLQELAEEDPSESVRSRAAAIVGTDPTLILRSLRSER